jgi:hypothetical protein
MGRNVVVILDDVHRGIMFKANVYFNTPSSEQVTLIHWKDFHKDYFYPKNLSQMERRKEM